VMALDAKKAAEKKRMQEAALAYDAAAMKVGLAVPAVPTPAPVPASFTSPQVVAPGVISEPTTATITSPELYAPGGHGLPQPPSNQLSPPPVFGALGPDA